MIAEWLYDRNGDAKLFLDEDKFFSKAGEEIGNLDGYDVFSSGGEVIGFYLKGVLYDSDHRTVAFTETAKGFIPELDDIIGSPGIPDFSDFDDGTTDYSEETGLVHHPEKRNGLGQSGEPIHPVRGGWSDESVDDLFGVKL